VRKLTSSSGGTGAASEISRSSRVMSEGTPGAGGELLHRAEALVAGGPEVPAVEPPDLTHSDHSFRQPSPTRSYCGNSARSDQLSALDRRVPLPTEPRRWLLRENLRIAASREKSYWQMHAGSCCGRSGPPSGGCQRGPRGQTPCWWPWRAWLCPMSPRLRPHRASDQ
jgi:hypothetical protein